MEEQQAPEGLSDGECTVHFTYITELKDVEVAMKEINKHAVIAVDCEGVSLSRSGTLTLLQVCTPKYHVFLFDVLCLGDALFTEGGMKELLEGAKITKVFFDCRADSDCLFHNFGVKLDNMYDVSVSDVWIRINTLPRPPGRLNGYKRCVENYLLSNNTPSNQIFTIQEPSEALPPPPSSTYFQELKARVSQLMEDSSSFWADRPLSQDVLEYAAFDVTYLMELYEKLSYSIRNDTCALRCVKEGSLLFAGLYRDKPEETPRSRENAKIPIELKDLWRSIRLGKSAVGRAPMALNSHNQQAIPQTQHPVIQDPLQQQLYLLHLMQHYQRQHYQQQLHNHSHHHDSHQQQHSPHSYNHYQHQPPPPTAQNNQMYNGNRNAKGSEESTKTSRRKAYTSPSSLKGVQKGHRNNNNKPKGRREK